MRKILLASHGFLAKGMHSAAGIICGDISSVDYICGYIDDIPLQDKIDKYFETINKNDEIIVLTDLSNGSVNTAFIPYINSHAIKLISGINLSLVISIVMENSEVTLSDEEILELIDISKQDMKFINHSMTTTNSGDDFDF